METWALPTYLAVKSDAEFYVARYADYQSAEKRAEEAMAMARFDHDFAKRHGPVFETISERLGLDYVILDCGEMRDGRLVLFEASIIGWVHVSDPVDIFPYKPAAMQSVFDGFSDMLVKRSTSHGGESRS